MIESVDDRARARTAAPRIRCRRIRADDLPALVHLMAEGFPERGEAWWRRSLLRLWHHASGMEVPDCGCLLEADGAAAGALLLIHGRGPGDGGPRCNLSSWHVRPGWTSYAPLLVAQATKRRDVTYFNISPAPHTLPIIEAQGFTRYSDGRILLLPWRPAAAPGASVRALDPARDAGRLEPGEAETLVRHRDHGCIALCVDAADGVHPFLFRSGRLRGGIPVATLVYCRDLAAVGRFAGPLGRALLRRGIPVAAVEADGCPAALPGWRRPGRAPRYCKGPRPPRPGDLTDSELALFDP